MATYLENLTLRLATGVAQLPDEVRQRHARYVLAAQRPDGGLAGREGGRDLYYTGFALRSLAILGELYGEPAAKAGTFLQLRLDGRESIVDFLSLIYGAKLLEAAAGINVFQSADAAWPVGVANMLEKLRRDD